MTFLIHVNQGNDFGDSGAARLCEGLKTNTTLQTLFLSCGDQRTKRYSDEIHSIFLSNNYNSQSNWRIRTETFRWTSKDKHDTHWSSFWWYHGMNETPKGPLMIIIRFLYRELHPRWWRNSDHWGIEDKHITQETRNCMSDTIREYREIHQISMYPVHIIYQ